MGRPPSNGAPSFRFNHTEVAQMETILREHEGQVPTREYLEALAEKFSNAPERAGKVTVQMKQAWNWFQNRRYALRSKLVKSPGKLHLSPPMPREEVAPVRNVPHTRQQIPVSSGHNIVRSSSENCQMEFEAKSARDGAWYDVQAFLSHRYLETGNPEVLVRFVGFGAEEDEWINVRKHARPRSLPCESSECVAVLATDLILCFQEGKEQALYFDAHVLDAQRRRHDIRGCRCRFLVRYDHDQSEEIVPLRKICRRPETDHRLQILHAANEAATAAAASASASEPVPLVLPTQQKPAVVVATDPSSTSSACLRVTNPNPTLMTAISPPPLPKNNISPPVAPPEPSPHPLVGPIDPSPLPPVGPSAPCPAVAATALSQFPHVGPAASSPFASVDPTAPSPFPHAGPSASSPSALVGPSAPSSFPHVGPSAPSSFPHVGPSAPCPLLAPTAPSPFPHAGPTASSPVASVDPSVDPTAPSPFPHVGPAAPSPFPHVGPAAPSPFVSVDPTAPSPSVSMDPTVPSSFASVDPTVPSPFPSVGPTVLSTPLPVAVSDTVPVSIVPEPSLPIAVSVLETSMDQNDTPPGFPPHESASQENITRPSEEARKDESANELSNPQLEQVMSDSPKAIAAVPDEPEKSESISNSGHPELVQVASDGPKVTAAVPDEPEKSESGDNSGHPELRGASETLPTEDIKE